MTIYNASVPVVANIEAPDGQAAVRKLTEALERAGFIPYEPERWAVVFEAEQDPEAIGGLPGAPQPGKLPKGRVVADALERARLTELQDRAELVGRSLWIDGRRHNPVRTSFMQELRNIVGRAFKLEQELRGEDFHGV